VDLVDGVDAKKCRHAPPLAMTCARAAALAGSLCLHGVLLAFARWHPGPGTAGPDAGGDQSALFSEAPAAEPPEPPPALPSSLPDIAEALPVARETLPDEEMIPPLVTGVTAAAHHTAASGGGPARKLPGFGSGKGRGGGGDGSYVAPSYLNNPPPPYPLAARLSRREGTVLLEVTVTGQGRVAEVEVLRSSGEADLDRAAVAAVRRWTFHPATAGGRAVAARVEVPVRFRLREPLIKVLL